MLSMVLQKILASRPGWRCQAIVQYTSVPSRLYMDVYWVSRTPTKANTHTLKRDFTDSQACGRVHRKPAKVCNAILHI